MPLQTSKITERIYRLGSKWPEHEKKYDCHVFLFFFVFYVFFSLSPTIQSTLGESHPVLTSTSNSSQFLRRPSDYCSDITSMVSSLNRIFHLNHFKIFILMIHLQMMQTMTYWTFLWHMTQAKPVFFSNYLFIYLFIYLLIIWNVWTLLSKSSKNTKKVLTTLNTI